MKAQTISALADRGCSCPELTPHRASDTTHRHLAYLMTRLFAYSLFVFSLSRLLASSPPLHQPRRLQPPSKARALVCARPARTRHHVTMVTCTEPGPPHPVCACPADLAPQASAPRMSKIWGELHATHCREEVDTISKTCVRHVAKARSSKAREVVGERQATRWRSSSSSRRSS